MQRPYDTATQKQLAYMRRLFQLSVECGYSSEQLVSMLTERERKGEFECPGVYTVAEVGGNIEFLEQLLERERKERQ